MTIEEIVIHNYGAFAGRCAIDLRPGPNRNIVLFGGQNGSGKTTLLEAIRLCFYGRQFQGGMSTHDYEELLASRIHRSTRAAIQPSEAIVSVLFTFGEDDGPHSFLVTRSWTKKSGKRIEETFDLLRDGRPVEDVSDEYWEEFLLNLIPRSISDLFFFDGEQIQTLADDSGDGQALCAAIKSLLGVDIVERLQADLRVYSSKALADMSDPLIRSQINAAEQELLKVRSELEEAERPLSAMQALVAEIQEKIKQAESELVASGGTFAKNRESQQQKRAVLRAKIAELESRVRQACAGVMPLAIARELGVRVQGQLDGEQVAQEAVAQNKALKWARLSMTGKLTAAFERNHIKSAKVRSDLLSVVTESLRDVSLPDTTVVHGLSPEIADQVRTHLLRSASESSSEMKQVANELEKLNRQLHQLEKDIERIPSQSDLAPKLAELGSLHSRLGSASSDAMQQHERVGQLQNAASEAQRKFEKLTTNAAALVSAQANANVAIKAIEALKEFKQRLIDKRLAELEAVATECFRVLLRKKRWVGRICVDPDSYSVTIRTTTNHLISKSRLSAGEKQVYAISMLWALAKISQRPLPMIIDTPLGRLDSEHRELLVKSYFPIASHQIVVLSTDTEIDHERVGDLAKFISRSYRLEFDAQSGSTTVIPGYFWEIAN
jgi:DNA sulfur modification protein DndD